MAVGAKIWRWSDREYQGRGIGTKLIKSAITSRRGYANESATSVNKPIRLRVLNGNPAKRLCLRWGFKTIQTLANGELLEKVPSR